MYFLLPRKRCTGGGGLWAERNKHQLAPLGRGQNLFYRRIPSCCCTLFPSQMFVLCAIFPSQVHRLIWNFVCQHLVCLLIGRGWAWWDWGNAKLFVLCTIFLSQVPFLEVDNTFLCYLDSDYFKISSNNGRPSFLVTFELVMSGVMSLSGAIWWWWW